MSGAPDPVVAGDPAVASDEAANGAVQEDEREEQVEFARKAAMQQALNVANFKKGDPYAMVSSRVVTRRAKVS